MKNITQSLSRWNHTATRFRTLGQNLSQQAYDTLAETRITSPIDAEQSKALEALGQKALRQLEDAQVALETSGVIRAALAEKNAEAGIARKLALLDALKAEQKALERTADISLIVMPSAHHERANEALDKHKDSEERFFARNVEIKKGVALRLVPMDAFDAFEKRIMVIKSDIQAMSDEVNDLNNASMTLELSDAAATLLNL